MPDTSLKDMLIDFRDETRTQLREFREETKDEFKAIRQGVLADHEKRLRIQETFRLKVMGAFALLIFLIGAVAKVVVSR